VIEPVDYDIIQNAFNRWESLVTIDSRFPLSQTITISYVIDTLGTNVLGGASITDVVYVDNNFIYGNVIPNTANITMNNTYLYGLKNSIRNDGFSSYYHVLLHEIGHILGIGSFWYLTGCPKTGYIENGTTKHYYTGTNAFREYKSVFAGFSNDAFLGIPIEDDGGAGTAGVHPEEGPEGGLSTDNRYINGIFHPGLDTELMTGWLDSSPISTPLSRITLGFLEDIGYTVNYNLADVYTMAWLATTDANNLEQTYVQGFLDVSGGNMINRNGNLSVLDGTMDVNGDVTFDSKLSVGGDISFNGTTIDICGNLYAQYPDNSIPSAAIAGLGDVTPNFTGDVGFQAGVTIATKAAIGSTTLPTDAGTALKVTGDLDFTGSLLNNGVEYVSGATDLSGLSDVIVGGANFANSLLIGSTTTGVLYNTTNNVGVGADVFNSLTGGIYNVANGYGALYKTTTGSFNTAFGDRTLYKNTSGNSNTAIGATSLHNNTTGLSNTATGNNALWNNREGSSNTANGFGALFNNTTGQHNTVMGYQAGQYNTSGESNTSIGYSSGQVNTTGKYNTYIGQHADAAAGLDDLSNSTAIGYNAKVTASNQIMLGTATETVIATGQVDICGNLYAQYASFNAQLYGNTITDGTATLTGGDLSGCSSVTANSITDGTATLTGGDLSGCSSVTSTTITDGTATLTGGDLSGCSRVTATTITDGTATLTGGDLSGCSRVTATTITDGTATLTGGDLSGCSSVTATSITDGTATLTGGALSGGSSVSATSITDGTATLTGGALSGITSIGAESAAFSATTVSSSTITGALTIGGGVGIAGALYVGGDLSWNSANIANDSIPKSAIIGSNHFTGDVSMNNNLEVVEHITITPINVSVNVAGIQLLDQSLKFTIPNSMTTLKYFCTVHSSMIGDFILASSPSETDKTYYVRTTGTTDPFYIFSATPNGTALNDTAAIGSGLQLTLYKGNTYTFIKTDSNHPFMVGDSYNVTTGMKLESTGDGAVTASTYRDPYPLHVNGMANIENNLNVARALTVSGPIRQW